VHAPKLLHGLVDAAERAALAVAENATEAAILTGNEQFAVWALWADAVVSSVAGETDRALAGAREAVARCDRVAETFFSSLSRLHLAAALSAAASFAWSNAGCLLPLAASTRTNVCPPGTDLL